MRISRVTVRAWRTASTTLPVPASPLVEHRRALGDATERLAEVPAPAHEGHREFGLVDVVVLVRHRQHLALVDVVDLGRLEDLRLDEVADPRLGHDGDRHRRLDARDHLRVAHPRHAPVHADVRGDALQRHHRHRARLLRDARLLRIHDVHDHAALEHLRHADLHVRRARRLAVGDHDWNALWVVVKCC